MTDTTTPVADTGWIVSLQCWAGHPLFTRHKPPKVTTAWFATREQAEQRKATLRRSHPDVTTTLICISPAPASFRRRNGRKSV
jgi:hypothetical protein